MAASASAPSTALRPAPAQRAALAGAYSGSSGGRAAGCADHLPDGVRFRHESSQRLDGIHRGEDFTGRLKE